MKRKINFVTGNAKKLAEVADIFSEISDIHLGHVDIDLTEIQGTPEDIISEKCKEALKRLGTPVIVEDTCLCFDALNGLPGPYIKWFIKALGSEGVWRMLDGFENKKAIAQCIFAYGIPDGEIRLFSGVVTGHVVPPAGENNFGWDPIFRPDGYTQTYSEMPVELKNKISHRFKAISALSSYLKDCSANK